MKSQLREGGTWNEEILSKKPPQISVGKREKIISE